MPVYSESRKYLFVCTPGTGSTSFSAFLLDHVEGKWLPTDHVFLHDGTRLDYKHGTVSQVESANLLSHKEIQNLFKFCFVRNPYSWILSDYLRHRKWKKLLDDRASWVQRDREARQRIQLALEHSLLEYAEIRVKPGDMFGRYVEQCDRWFRVEDLRRRPNIWTELGEYLGDIRPTRLRHLNKTSVNTSLKANRDLFSDEVMQVILSRMLPTFERYGYPADVEKCILYF